MLSRRNRIYEHASQSTSEVSSWQNKNWDFFSRDAEPYSQGRVATRALRFHTATGFCNLNETHTFSEVFSWQNKNWRTVKTFSWLYYHAIYTLKEINTSICSPFFLKHFLLVPIFCVMQGLIRSHAHWRTLKTFSWLYYDAFMILRFEEINTSICSPFFLQQFFSCTYFFV